MHERQLSIPQGGSTWQPSVVLEGRVRRLMGPLFGGEGTRYAEMYVHDAMSGNCTGDVVYPEALPLSIQTFAVEGMAILRSMSGLRTMEDYLSLLHTTGQAVQPATDMQVMVDTLPDEHFELDAPNFDNEGPSFEVPHHGYLFNEEQVHWDGAICSWRGLSEDEFINSLMNDEFFDEYVGIGVFEDDMNYGISQAMHV